MEIFKNFLVTEFFFYRKNKDLFLKNVCKIFLVMFFVPLQLINITLYYYISGYKLFKVGVVSGNGIFYNSIFNVFNVYYIINLISL